MPGGHADRWRIIPPAVDQLIQGSGLDHCPGKNMTPDLRGLFDHADIELFVELLEPNRAGQPRRPGTDYDNIVLHDFAI